MNNRILLIRTGGTIDSEPYEDPYHPPDIVNTLKGEDSLIMRTVAKLPNQAQVDGFSWVKWAHDFSSREASGIEDHFVKDSTLFKPEEIRALARIIKEDDEHRFFVITHGTVAMAKNAAALEQELQGSDKTVVFTGAMVPLSMHGQHESDGIPALDFTLQNITQKKAGVYIVGHDLETKRLRFFDPATVEKDASESLASLEFTLKPKAR